MAAVDPMRAQYEPAWQLEAPLTRVVVPLAVQPVRLLASMPPLLMPETVSVTLAVWLTEPSTP